MTIESFIHARLDEAEATSRQPRDGAGATSGRAQPIGVQELKLARVQVIRQVLAEHECDRFALICLTCRSGGSDEGWASEAWPCPTVRQIAALWAEHPAYDTAWSPREGIRVDRTPTVPRQRRASNGAWLYDVTDQRDRSSGSRG